ncbi:hypothetical protein M427DRAFT_121199 [Gonapodya prolifera JEL478]|uniref:Iron-sulfur assembly protein 1 n=1 Tax=Gonapodya prolifera (strain JEL478) TaxID=1344416 RepID=A0A139ANM8_GONPJ|nr:hypothetical protein M427DRAFT_121199 [Gonapodya prolifera JEL478]|eukprot:KXS18357.1 hypothetical protein M427DRAFT_121199 [Gonapodya prolifera JEL478]
MSTRHSATLLSCVHRSLPTQSPAACHRAAFSTSRHPWRAPLSSPSSQTFSLSSRNTEPTPSNPCLPLLYPPYARPVAPLNASSPVFSPIPSRHMSSVAAKVRKAPKTLRARKSILSLTPSAVSRIRHLQTTSASRGGPQKFLRVGVKSRGCSGLQYFLEEVDGGGKFDEVVQQEGVTVLVDSKALFSIIGSEMDYVEDRLSAKFVFNNPNVKDACGCGESFNVDTSADASQPGAPSIPGPEVGTLNVQASRRLSAG